MLKHRILCVGRRARDPLLSAADDYLDRVGRYARAELERIRDSDKETEGKQLIRRLREGEHVIALDEHGEQPTSADLAQKLRQWEQSNQEHIAWIVGGADGLARPVQQRAHEMLALSRLTLPHRLALALLAEQLYRAHSMLRNERYHRG